MTYNVFGAWWDVKPYSISQSISIYRTSDVMKYFIETILICADDHVVIGFIIETLLW